MPTRAFDGSGTAANKSVETAPAPSSARAMRAKSAVSFLTRASSCFVSVKISSVFSRAAEISRTTAAVASLASNSAKSAAFSPSVCACASRVQQAMRYLCLRSSRMSSNLS